jgi:hypothetical protein
VSKKLGIKQHIKAKKPSLLAKPSGSAWTILLFYIALIKKEI